MSWPSTEGGFPHLPASVATGLRISTFDLKTLQEGYFGVSLKRTTFSVSECQSVTVSSLFPDRLLSYSDEINVMLTSDGLNGSSSGGRSTCSSTEENILLKGEAFLTSGVFKTLSTMSSSEWFRAFSLLVCAALAPVELTTEIKRDLRNNSISSEWFMLPKNGSLDLPPS